jgi:hypothetical protein
MIAGTVALASLYLWVIGQGRKELGEHTVFSLFDDAMISMRYASNLAHGAGLRFNQGFPATEGYSNFLWTLWMAVLHLLPVSNWHVPLLVALSAAGLLFANLALVWQLVRRLGGDEKAAWRALGFCALSFSLVYWSLRGMEVALIAALLDAALLLALGMAEKPSRGSKVARRHGHRANVRDRALASSFLRQWRCAAIVPSAGSSVWSSGCNCSTPPG